MYVKIVLKVLLFITIITIITITKQTNIKYGTERGTKMIYGYARISTRQQSIDRQICNIKAAYPEAVIVKEAWSGTKIERPEWSKLFKRAAAGDVIVFDSVSRMSRNAADGVQTYFDLYDRGVELVFLKEPHINTSVYSESLKDKIELTGSDEDLIFAGINAYMKRLAERQIALAFEQAQKEVDDLHQRTKEGIETARLAGKQIGQQAGRKLNVKKAAAAKEIILKHSKDFNGTLSDPEVMRLAGVSRNSYYKYKAELKEALLDDCITDDFTMVSKALKASK